MKSDSTDTLCSETNLVRLSNTWGVIRKETNPRLCTTRHHNKRFRLSAYCYGSNNKKCSQYCEDKTQHNSDSSDFGQSDYTPNVNSSDHWELGSIMGASEG